MKSYLQPEVSSPTSSTAQPGAGIDGGSLLGNAALQELLGQQEPAGGLSWLDWELPELGDWLGGGEEEIGLPTPVDGGPSRDPRDGERLPCGPDPFEPAPRGSSDVVQEHYDEYLAVLELAFDDPHLGSFDFGADKDRLSTALIEAWVQIGHPEQDTRLGLRAARIALHEAAMGALVPLHPDPAEQRAISRAFSRIAVRLMESTVYARITSPSAYGLSYPTAEVLGVDGVDVAQALAVGSDPSELLDAGGEAIDPGVAPDASAEERAVHLSALLAADELPAEHLAGAHDDVDALYTGEHAALIEQHGLPASSAEVHRQLQEKVVFANQRDNASIKEKDHGGTCNLTAVAMAMQAAGLTTPHDHRGVVLQGMQYEERLLSIALADDRTNLLSSDTWAHVVRVCGGVFEDLGMSGQSTWAQWQAVQSEHLDLGHGVIVSNNGHVLRIQSVDEADLTIDDPFSQGHVLETESHPGHLEATCHHTPAEEEPVEGQPVEGQPVEVPQPLPDQSVEVDAWKQAGKLWAQYDAETETFSEELTPALQDERCREAAAEATGSSPAEWTLVPGSKIRWRGNRDRRIGKKNDDTRDRSAEGYDRGDDVTWGKDETVGHYMNGVWAIHR